MSIIERRRELQQILDGHREILPGVHWLDRHLKNFPDGELPEQKLEVDVDNVRLHFCFSTKTRTGVIKEALRDL